MPGRLLRAVTKLKRTNDPTGLILTRYMLLVTIYVLLILLLPDNQAILREHRLTSTEYHILQFLVGLPLLAVWFMAFYGYAKLGEYARSIRKTPEALGFKRLTQGCTWIAWSLPIHSIVSLSTLAINNTEPGFSSAAIIAINYIDLLFPVVGFTLISAASRSLMERAKINLSAASIRGLMLLFVSIGVLYCYLVFRQFNGNGLAASNPYHLPAYLAVLTIIVPYLYAWFAGLLAVYELITYSRHVRGVLYRQPLHMLVIGLFTMALGSIAFQYSHSFRPEDYSHLTLGSYLLLSLIFQIVSGIGFLMTALGALRLKKIEEV